MTKYLLTGLLTIVGIILFLSIRNGQNKASQIEALSGALTVKNQVITLLSGNIKMHYIYSECQLPDIVLLDKDRNKTKLTSLLDGKNKVVFKFSSTNCSPCIQSGLLSIKKLTQAVSAEQLIVLADNSNRREIQALANNLNLEFPIYLTKDTVFDRILKKENIPFMFVVGADLQMKDLFIPMKELPDYSDLYHRIIWKKYFYK